MALFPSTTSPVGYKSHLRGPITKFIYAPLISLLPHSYKKLQPHQKSYWNTNLQLKMSSSIIASAGTEAVGEIGVHDSRCVEEKDLLIVGPGVLGRLVAESWKKENPSCRVVGQTRSTDHHQELQNLGIKPCLKGTQTSERFPFVIFCAPPSGSGDYPDDVRAATLQWNGEGSFLFTSSSAVYACNDNGLCVEDSPAMPIGSSPRTDVLLKAENEVLKVGGNVVRLAGLYTFDRGAHLYCLEKGTIEARPDHILNLIHYEDAASLCISILKGKFERQVFMGCDNHPLSRKDLMDYVNKSGKFEKKFHGFTD
ncbi:uncharacterized protein LOC131063707 isoform X2 [Cryptomeria japonica]|uniref:uncharacterized protein LOC131063707 isoform X2 n=1 Tax=Cryptomeria japonica TaxID=3369 RepID=UPI0027DAA56F|nr:uncharacterized protein LOC131063707 isoform X2 [Cryptomeria japonica]